MELPTEFSDCFLLRLLFLHRWGLSSSGAGADVLRDRAIGRERETRDRYIYNGKYSRFIHVGYFYSNPQFGDVMV